MNTGVWHSYSDSSTRLLLHATGLCAYGRGLLVGGAAGSGKSTLALDMMALGASLISDDRVWIEKTSQGVQMCAPSAVAGKVEARGIGILQVEHTAQAPLNYCINLSSFGEQRLPIPKNVTFLDVQVQQFSGGGIHHLAASMMGLLRYGLADDV